MCFLKDGNGISFCEHCDIKTAKDAFKEAAINMLDERFKDTWHEYKFDELVRSVITIVNSENDDHSLFSPTTDLLFEVYMAERNRLKRIDDWNFKKKLEAAKNGG